MVTFSQAQQAFTNAVTEAEKQTWREVLFQIALRDRGYLEKLLQQREDEILRLREQYAVVNLKNVRLQADLCEARAK